MNQIIKDIKQTRQIVIGLFCMILLSWEIGLCAMVSVPIDANGQNEFNKYIQNVGVNMPISIDFGASIHAESITNQTFYLSDLNGKKISGRIWVNGQIAYFIPQALLIPETQYVFVFKTILDATNTPFPSGTIYITTQDIDFGLYWFGKNGQCEKYVPGFDNAFYDPTKPTMIYTHGWKQNAVERNYERETFHFIESKESIDVYTNHAWIDKGWNTGILYWNQFCEESEVSDAEAKIWSFNGPQTSRYKLANGSYKIFTPQISLLNTTFSVNGVADLLFHIVYDALKHNSSGQIRFVGHSLGNQLITYLAKHLKDKQIPVKRLALLEPIWTKGEKAYLNDANHDGLTDHVTHRCLWYTLDLMNAYPSDFAMEIYNSSALELGAVGDRNEALRTRVADISIRPWFYGTTEIEAKHNVVRYHYLWSFAFNPPSECTINFWNDRIPTGKLAASASTSDNRIHEMMGTGKIWDQVEGRYTPIPEDDEFEIKDGDAPVSEMGTVSGVVQTDITGNMEKLSNVKVTLVETGQSVFSDQSGNFQFSNVSFGLYTLLFEKTGFKPLHLPFVPVTGGDTLSLVPVTITYQTCVCDMPGDVTKDKIITLKDAIKAIQATAGD